MHKNKVECIINICIINYLVLFDTSVLILFILCQKTIVFIIHLVFHLYCCRKNSKLNIVAECILKVYSANAEGTIYISCDIEYNALAVYSIQKCQTTVLFKY